MHEVGIAFLDNPEALELWRSAGANIEGERVRLPLGLACDLCQSAPSSFVQQARNPDKSVHISGQNLVTAPVYGNPFVGDSIGRQYATIEDFRQFVKLGYLSKWLHHFRNTLNEPTDLPVSSRHLDMLYAHMTLSDKPFTGSVTDPTRAEDTLTIAKLLFGGRFVDNKVVTSLNNINSPMAFNSTMMGVLEVYVKANQASIISPFIVGGAMAPASATDTLTQVSAKILASVTYSQLLRNGVNGLRYLCDVGRYESRCPDFWHP